jgi:hypothetical protein
VVLSMETSDAMSMLSRRAIRVYYAFLFPRMVRCWVGDETESIISPPWFDLISYFRLQSRKRIRLPRRTVKGRRPRLQVEGTTTVLF